MSTASRFDRPAREGRAVLHIAAHRPFRRMLAYQGIDPGRAWRECEDMIVRAQHRCSICAVPETCRLWLAEKHPRGTYPSFCPNGATIEACRIALDQQGPPAKRAVSDSSAAGKPIAAAPGSRVVQQLAMGDGVPPLNERATRYRGGILAELDALRGQLL